MLHCRDMRPGEEQEVLALVMRGFDEFVGQDFSEAGVAEFARSAQRFVLGHPAGHHITVADSNGELIGMVDLRDGSHVSLFFVEAAHQHRGVGATLLKAALAGQPQPPALTVNSAPSAVPAYCALGFAATAPEAELNGIRYVAMRKELSSRG